ncbi:MAG TPA: glutamate-5-semialdehyde dehydrogenase [Candidatus Brocadiia bacterium]|nr:glutamate-5-semialdehyde dehydrogenase [Candidatus Brocadiia bacterium]
MASVKDYVQDLCKGAKSAARGIAGADSATKNRALLLMAENLTAAAGELKAANAEDIASARADGRNAAYIDRLTLTDKRIAEMVDGLRQVATLPDPVGELIGGWNRPNGLQIRKVRVPLGVILIIYESRPNVTADAASLCLKAGNACILRGGSDAVNSNMAIAKQLSAALESVGLDPKAVQVVGRTARSVVGEILKRNDMIDVVIPRGGESLIRRVAEQSTIPVVKHYKGVCHVYVDKRASLTMAQEICLNAKCQRPATCNAMETMLVHKDMARRFLPKMAKAFAKAGTTLYGCKAARTLVPGIKPAKSDAWTTEYLDLILNVRVVDSIEEAIEHIETYGSHHSDAIVTEDYEAAQKFLNEVDSAAVYVNASTRFTDGAQFGMGAEIGISTDKLHARGPMALPELTSYKFVVFGNGQLRT